MYHAQAPEAPQPDIPSWLITTVGDYLIDDEEREALFATAQLLEGVEGSDFLTYALLFEHPCLTQGITELSIIAVDTDAVGNLVGLGDVLYTRYDADYAVELRHPAIADKPFINYTETRQQYTGQGLGIRRARVLNRLAQAYFGTVLHSDPEGVMDVATHRIWQRLIEVGEAELFMEVPLGEGESVARYRFVQSSGETNE